MPRVRHGYNRFMERQRRLCRSIFCVKRRREGFSDGSVWLAESKLARAACPPSPVASAGQPSLASRAKAGGRIRDRKERHEAGFIAGTRLRYPPRPEIASRRLPGIRALARDLRRDSNPRRRGRPSQHAPASSQDHGRHYDGCPSAGGKSLRAISLPMPWMMARHPNADAPGCFGKTQPHAASYYVRYGSPNNWWRNDRPHRATPAACAGDGRRLEAADRPPDDSSCSGDV